MKTKEKLSPQIVAFSQTGYKNAIDKRLPVNLRSFLSGSAYMEREPGADCNEGGIESGAWSSESQSNPPETSQKVFLPVEGEQFPCPAPVYNKTNSIFHGGFVSWCLNVRFCSV